MGTVLEIMIWDKVNEIIQEKIKSEIFNFTEEFDKYFSRFRKDSYISQIENKIGSVKISEDFFEILKIYKILNVVTNGSVSPFVGHTISDLGYDAAYTLRPKENIRKVKKFEEVVDWEKTLENKNYLEIKEKVLIDIGAVGKGYWCDKVKDILVKNNLKKFLVNGSGDMYFYNQLDGEKLKVKLEAPNMLNEEYVEIFNEALCGSGVNIRNWSLSAQENLHHIIDANLNKSTSIKKVTNTWVKTTSTAWADGLATALFFINKKTLKNNLSRVQISSELLNFWSFILPPEL